MMNEDRTEAVPAMVGQAEIVCPQILSLGKMGSTIIFATWQKVKKIYTVRVISVKRRLRSGPLEIGSQCPKVSRLSEALLLGF